MRVCKKSSSTFIHTNPAHPDAAAAGHSDGDDGVDCDDGVDGYSGDELYSLQQPVTDSLIVPPDVDAAGDTDDVHTQENEMYES